MWRWLCGLLRGKPVVKRSPAEQSKVDAATRQLALYHFEACPYCVRVKCAINQLDLQIELRNAHQPAHQQELRLQGGLYQTPCLRIGTAENAESAQWLYESAAIIHYLEQRFSRT